MNQREEHGEGRAASNGEIPTIVAEIEHLLKELEQSKSLRLGDALSTRLELIERKLGTLETMLGSIVPAPASADLNDLMERIIASRIRSDLESSVQALQMVRTYLHAGSRSAKNGEPGSTPETVRSQDPAPVEDPRASGDDRRSAAPRVPGENLDRILDHAGPEDREAVAKLSTRKREILYHLLRGKSNREIAGELGITEKTVKNNLYTIYQTLKVKSRTQLIHRMLNPIAGEPGSVPAK